MWIVDGRRPTRAFRSVVLPALALASAIAVGSLPVVAGTMSLRWDSVSGVAGYRVHYGTSSTALNQSQDAGASTSTDLSGLANCTTWYATVRAYDAQGLESEDGGLVVGWPRPVVNTVTPAQIERGQTVTFTVAGTNFDPGEAGNPSHPAATVELGHPGLRVDQVRVDACGQIRVTVTAALDASTGWSSLTVENPDLTHSQPGMHPWVFGTKAEAIQVVSSAPGDTTPPSVTATTPGPGATEVDPAVRPVVTFSEAVDPASVTTATVRLLDASGAVVPQAAGWPTTDGALVTIRPAALLTEGATYRVFVQGGSSGVKDLAGNALATNYQQNPGFTIREGDPSGEPLEPQVTGASPAAGTPQVDLDTDTARLTFDRDMSPLAGILSPSELQQRFWVNSGSLRLAHATGSPTFENGGRTVVIRLADPLQAGGSYSTNADLSGSSLEDRLTDAGHADLAMASPYATSPAWTTQDAVTRVSYQSEDGSVSGSLTVSNSAVPDENDGVPADAGFDVTFANPIVASSLDGTTVRIVKPGNESARAVLATLRASAAGRLAPTAAGQTTSLVSRVAQMLFLGRTDYRSNAKLSGLLPETVETEDPELQQGGIVLHVVPLEPLRPGTLYELLIEGGSGGIRMLTENGETTVQAPSTIRIPFYTEVSPETQDVTLGVGR